MRAMPENRLAWLDSLRGGAVIFVFLLHTMLDLKRHAESFGVVVVGLGAFEKVVFGFFDFGKIGVGIFFVVSGYLIPVTLDKAVGAPIKEFFLNRFFRLYPAYWVSILLLMFFVGSELSGWQLAINATMFQRFVGVPDASGVYWTLQIELVFYLSCVLLKVGGVLNRRWLPAVAIAVFGLAAIGLAAIRFKTGAKLPVAVALALQLMFFGYQWRLWALQDKTLVRLVLFGIVLIAITLVAACPLAYSRDYGFGDSWSRYMVSYFAAVTIFCVVSLGNWWQSSVGFLGRISYSFYLVHAIVVAVVVEWMLPAGVSIVGLRELLVTILLSFALAVLSSWLLYVSVEEAGVKLGKYLIVTLRERSPASDLLSGEGRHGG